jgi:hypothetical protein
MRTVSLRSVVGAVEEVDEDAQAATPLQTR